MWIAPLGRPGPVTGLRPDTDRRAAEPACRSVRTIPKVFQTLSPSELPQVFHACHDLPEDVRLAFSHHPGKECNGKPTPPNILHERLRSIALDCLDGGCVEALQYFSEQKELRKPWSKIGAVPKPGETGEGRATQYDAGNVVYALTWEVIRHIANADGRSLTLRCSNVQS